MLSRFEEYKLIVKCAATDNRRAFARLVDEYSPTVRNFLFRLTAGDAALTDDLSQETFIKAYESLRSFKGLSKLSTWLLRIAYNQFVDYTRRRHESLLSPDTSPSEYMWSDARDDTRNSEICYDLQTAMTVLPPVERTLITLFYFDDLPLKDICKITQLPDGTVKSYLSRAKSKMAKMLKSDNI